MTKTPESFDDLLGDVPTPEEKSNLAALKDDGVPVESDAEKRFRLLEERLAEAEARAAAAEEKTAVVEQTAAEKEQAHRQALQQTNAVLAAPERFETVEDDDPNVIHIHILHSGLTFAGRVWNYGQEVKIKKDGQAYKSSVNRNGSSWLDDLSYEAQVKRFGKVVVGHGPYTGPAFNDAIAAEDAKRGTAVPVVLVA